jgi:signal transduction histidine kinase
LEDIDNREIIEDVIPFVDGRYIRRYSAQIRGLEDEYFGRLYIFEDITEKESLAHSLMEAIEREKELNEMKSKFVSMASHEFRTPLASILMATETMENYFDRMNKEELKKYLQRIRKNIEFLREMINKFLNLSRIETGKMPFMPESTEIVTFINNWLEEFSIKNVIKQSIGFEKEFREATLTIDRQLMLQVFDNLVTNSIKYSPEDSPITIRVEKLDDSFLFIFEDKGIGIPAKDQGKLFEAFFRASNTGNIHGTGLGLPLVKQIVDRHDGKLWFESTENVGTTFYVEIPCNLE